MASLLALSRAESAVAKRYLSRRWYAHGVTLVAAVIALFVSVRAAYFLAALGVITELAAWGLRYYGDILHDRAEQARRLALIDFGLGGVGAEIAAAKARARFTHRAHALAPELEDPHYYATTAPPGPQRLKAALRESVFYSEELYRFTGVLALSIAGVLSGAAVAVFATIVAVGPDDPRLAIARVLVTALAVAVATDGLGIGVSWWRAADEIEKIALRLENVDFGEVDSALALFGDYGAITGATPPIPDTIYGWRKDEINQRWAERQQELAATSAVE